MKWPQPRVKQWQPALRGKLTRTSGRNSMGRIQATPLQASLAGQKWTGACAKSDRCLATDHWLKSCRENKLNFQLKRCSNWGGWAREATERFLATWPALVRPQQSLLSKWMFFFSLVKCAKNNQAMIVAWISESRWSNKKNQATPSMIME